MSARYDIILMGATSFVGQITAKRFAELLKANPEACKVAFAGRSQTKLDELTQQLEASYGVKFDTLVKDSMNEAETKELAEATRVVVSTVGPYELFGEALVKACAQSGTHYCDLTGEPQFIYRMLQAYEADAKASGACIVHCCGFDSIPSDIGVYFLQQQAQEKFGAPCEEVDMRVKAASGGFSGGTIASLMNVIKQTRETPSLKKVLFNPYALCNETKDVKQKYVGKVMADWATDNWLAPFVMAGINSKVVMRSAEQLSERYGETFKYNEAMMSGRGGKGKRRAKIISFGLGVITVGAAFAVSRGFLEKFVLPSPGQGPSLKEQENGFFVIHHYGKTANGDKLAIKVTGDQDPGYGSTSKMLSQSALALAFDLPEGTHGGFWTPASLLGDALLKRLPENAGFTFDVLS